MVRLLMFSQVTLENFLLGIARRHVVALIFIVWPFKEVQAAG